MSDINIHFPSTALILIDLQQGIIAMPTEPHTAKQVIKNANQLIQKFKQKNALIILVRVAAAADGKDALKPDCDEPMLSSIAERPKNWSELSPDLLRTENDFVITKRQWGAFYGTELDLELRRRGINTIVIGGIATNYGVESTARDAYERGYSLVFVEDAMSSRNPVDHQFACQRIFPRIGKVRKTSDLIQS